MSGLIHKVTVSKTGDVWVAETMFSKRLRVPSVVRIIGRSFEAVFGELSRLLALPKAEQASFPTLTDLDK